MTRRASRARRRRSDRAIRTSQNHAASPAGPRRPTRRRLNRPGKTRRLPCRAGPTACLAAIASDRDWSRCATPCRARECRCCCIDGASPARTPAASPRPSRRANRHPPAPARYVACRNPDRRNDGCVCVTYQSCTIAASLSTISPAVSLPGVARSAAEFVRRRQSRCVSGARYRRGRIRSPHDARGKNAREAREVSELGRPRNMPRWRVDHVEPMGDDIRFSFFGAASRILRSQKKCASRDGPVTHI